MILSTKPDDFRPKFEVVSCFIESNKKILLLHRQGHKPQGNTWGVPAGKININEKPADAMVRELQEEIGYAVSPSNLTYFKEFFVRYPEYDFTYKIYHHTPKELPSIRLNLEEHKSFIWISPLEALKMNLIPDEDTCIKAYYSSK